MKTQFLGAVAIVLSAALMSCAAPKPSILAPTVEPQIDTVFTSTREIRGLKVVGKTLWAATSGGVLRLENGKWSKWTVANGLPSNEALQFEEGKAVKVRFPLHSATYDGKTWQSSPAPAFQRFLPQTTWNGNAVIATLDGFQVGAKTIKLPAESGGSHLSAFESGIKQPKQLLMAIYGDGIWGWNGQKWFRPVSQPPAKAREITALNSGDGDTLWIGTRRDGLFRRQNGKWQQLLQSPEPFSHNTQFFGRFRDTLFASTLDDGLVYCSGNSWQHVKAPTISSSAPRQMFVWKDRLYLRHGGGIVDSFDGATWTKSALKDIPRPGIYALGGDENRLIASGWGGFAEWDGQTWTPHYDLPLLKGIAILGIVPDGEDLYLLTQSRGLMKWSRADNELTVFDERNGLPDDWITAFARSGDELFAGTFVGGLCRYDGKKWIQYSQTKGENITGIEAIEGGVIATSRSGAWRVKNGEIERVDESWIEPELQAVMRTKGGVWLGGRTSINFWKS